MIINDEQVLENMKADADAGKIQLWRYVAKRYKLTESDAKQWVKEANELNDETTGVNTDKINSLVTSGVMSIREAQRVLNPDMSEYELEIMYIRTLVEKGIALTNEQADLYNGITTVENEVTPPTGDNEE